MKSMEEMLQAAQQAAETIQTQMNDMQVKLDSIEVEGKAGGGLVTVRATAKGRILGVNRRQPDEAGRKADGRGSRRRGVQ